MMKFVVSLELEVIPGTLTAQEEVQANAGEALAVLALELGEAPSHGAPAYTVTNASLAARFSRRP